jgi:REP element-mobilizing transposase RayT
MPNSYTALYYHIVFSTKERRPLISSEWQGRLYAYVGGMASERRSRLLAAGGMQDHVHFLVSLHPTNAVSDFLRVIKTNSSKWIHEMFAGQRSFGWQDGYSAFSVSVSRIDAVRRYIANQATHHAKRSFQDELRLILRRHGIAFDERYVWD